MAANGSAQTGAGISGPAAARRMPEGRRFQPGQSGNPRGRSKRDRDVAEAARQHTTEALAVLAEVMRDEGAPPSARVTAANAILDRGWGKPPQSLDVTHRATLGEEFEALIRSLNGGRDARLIDGTEGCDD